MKGPWLFHVAALSQGAPVVTALVLRRPVRRARAWLLAWCAMLVVADYALLSLAVRGVHNLWIVNVMTPVNGVLVLWTLSLWQTGEAARLTLRLAIVPFFLVWGILILTLENTSTFSRAADPMGSLVCLAAAAYTLLARSHAASGELLRQDWFWVSAGMTLYFGVSSTATPLSALLVGSDPVLLLRAYEVRALAQIAAFLLIARGMACRVPS
jgi:hypothetical protein